MSVGQEHGTRVSTKLGEDNELRENRRKDIHQIIVRVGCAHRKVPIVK